MRLDDSNVSSIKTAYVLRFEFVTYGLICSILNFILQSPLWSTSEVHEEIKTTKQPKKQKRHHICS